VIIGNGVVYFFVLLCGGRFYKNKAIFTAKTPSSQRKIRILIRLVLGAS